LHRRKRIFPPGDSRVMGKNYSASLKGRRKKRRIWRNTAFTTVLRARGRAKKGSTSPRRVAGESYMGTKKEGDCGLPASPLKKLSMGEKAWTRSTRGGMGCKKGRHLLIGNLRGEKNPEQASLKAGRRRAEKIRNTNFTTSDRET